MLSTRMVVAMKYLWSINGARVALGDLGRTKLYQLVSRGDLQLVHIDGRSFITDESIRALIQKASETSNISTSTKPALVTTTPATRQHHQKGSDRKGKVRMTPG